MARRLIKIFEIRIHDRPPEDGSGVFRKVKETSATDDALLDGTFEALPRCKHGHLIHTPQELGGQCATCGAYLCTDCTNLRCSLDGNLVCREHAMVEGEEVLCGNHGFLRTLAFSLFKG